jgi:molecular chaperone GrpE
MSKHSENIEKDPGPLKSAIDIAAERHQSDSSSSETEMISKKELEELRSSAAKAKEHWDRLLRSQADLDNYRKRMTRERQDLIKVANEKLLLELLTPIDHFEMGLQSVQKGSDKDPLREGMELVLNQFKQFLKNQGVSEINATDETFNPAFHEAINHQESDLPEGQVVQQIRKGYKLQDKVLRPATVIVSKGKPDQETSSDQTEPNS